MSIIHRNNIKPGDGLVRAKSLFGIIDHYGLYVGQYQVIENHPDFGVRLTSLDEFLQGRPLQKIKKFPGNDIERSNAISRAYGMIGARYDALKFNCEHFVNMIHRIGIKSLQVEVFQNLVVGLLIIGFIAAISGD